jgi:uncharacterized phage infection (PIP) family protein YhgE
MPVARDGQESHGGHTMDKKENQPREKKGMPLAPVFLLGATVLLLIEMYFIVNLPRLYLVQIILGAAILACTYVFIAALLKEIHKSGEQAKDEYERMLRGEKASYLMLKKISEQLEAVDRNTREPGEEIITAQKAIAKVTITRSKENADALMNSNDRVVDNLLQLKESMDAGFEQFAGKQQNMMDDSVKELVLKQQEFAEELKEITAGLKEITEGLQTVKETVAEEKAQTLAAIESRMDELVSQNAVLESKITESTAAAAAQKPEPDMEPELVMEPQPEEDFSMPDTPEEELPVVDAETVTDDTPVLEEYEEPVVDSDAIVEEEDAAAATDDQNEAEAERGAIDSFDFGADGLDFGGDSLDLGVDGLDLGTENLDLGADNLDAGAGGLDLGADSLDLGGDSLDLGADSLDLGAENLDLGTENLDLGVDSLDLGADSLDLGAENLDLGTENLDLGVDSLDLGADGSDLGGESLDLGADLKEEAAPENEAPDEPEPVAAPENEIPDEPKVAEPQKEPETKAEEAAPMDFSDPHKLMTPEEIAALIAKM